MGPTLGPEPCPLGYEFHNLSKELRGYHNHEFSFFSQEKSIFENLAFLEYLAPPMTPLGG